MVVDKSAERDTKEVVFAQLRATAVGDDPEARERARQLFLSLGYYDETTLILRTADSPTERVKAAEILGLTGSHFATPHLVAGLFDSSPEVQRAAAEALARIGDPDVAAGPLKALIDDEEGSLMRALAQQREAQLAEAARARKEAEDAHAAELEYLRREQSELHQAVAVAAVRRAEIRKARWSAEAEMRELAEEQQQLARALETRRVEAERMRLKFEAEQRANEKQLRQHERALSHAAENVARRRSELETASQQADAETHQLAAALGRIHEAEETRRRLAEERSRLEAEAWRQAEEERCLLEEIRDRAREQEERLKAAVEHRAAERDRILELQAVCSRLEEEAREQSLKEQKIRIEAQGWAGLAEHLRERVAQAEVKRREAAEQYRELRDEAREDAEQREPESVIVTEQSLILSDDTFDVPPVIVSGLHSDDPAKRAQALIELARSGAHAAFRLISKAFDDISPDVRGAAARALCELEPYRRAEAFTQAIEAGTPERSSNIGAALVSSGLAAEAVENLSSENRENTYDALCLLLAMARTGEIDPLIRAIEAHQNVEVRRASIKLLTLSGHSDIAEAAVKRRLMLRPKSPLQPPVA